MSGWDWLHAGLEVATYAKAQQAKQELAEMRTSAEVEAARRVLLEAMRNLIFDISRDIQLAEEQLTEFPQQVYIVSRSLDWRLANSGLSADVFPDFQDKEYVLGTEKRIAEVVEKSGAHLTEKQLEQSERAVQYIAEMPMLHNAISAKSAKESLSATDEQWEEVNSRQSKKKKLKKLGFIGLGLTMCVGVWLIIGGLASLGTGLGGAGGDIDLGSIISGLLLTAGGAAIPAGSIALLVVGNKPNPEYEPLKANREGWQGQLLPEGDWQQVISSFGDLTSEQFKSVYEERLAFLRPLLGDDFQKYLTSGE